MNYPTAWILLSLVTGSALAQENSGSELQLGAGVRSRPLYDGSNEQTTDVIPFPSYANGLGFVRSSHGFLEGGMRVYIASGVKTGVQLAYEAGPRDGDPGASLGAYLEWSAALGPAPINVLARMRNHLDSDRGRLLDVRATAGVYGHGGLRAGLFWQATWADEQHLRSYYEVRDSGLLFTSVGLLGAYKLDSRWSVLLSAEQRQLDEAPSSSPLVRDRSNGYITTGLAFRF